MLPSSLGDDLMASQWYYAKGGEQHGPISGRELKELATSGGLGPADLVWKEGMPEWRPAGGLQGLFPGIQPVAASPSKSPIEKPIILPPPPISQTPSEGIGTSPAKQAGLFDMARSFSQKATEAVAKVQVKVEA
jgi:GYF domain 2